MAITEAEVIQLLTDGGDYDLVTAPVVTRYVAIAARQLAKIATCASDDGDAIDADTKDEIQRLLAAHAYAMVRRQATSESRGRASASWGGVIGEGLKETTYGRLLLTLDFTGCIASTIQGADVDAGWLGLAPSEQTDYVDRD